MAIYHCTDELLAQIINTVINKSLVHSYVDDVSYILSIPCLYIDSENMLARFNFNFSEHWIFDECCYGEMVYNYDTKKITYYKCVDKYETGFKPSAEEILGIIPLGEHMKEKV